MPLKIHITSINKEIDEQGNLINEDTIKFTNQQIDKFMAY